MRALQKRSFRGPLMAGCLVLSVALAGCSSSEPEPAGESAEATVFEGARLILGDGTAPIENGTFVVTGDRITAVGRTGEVQAPEGAARVDLTGKTVMPAIVDTHTHLSREREPLVEDLRHRVYYGVVAAMSLGQDEGDLPFQIRDETIPNAARFRTAGRGITMPEPGRTEIPYWVSTEAEARKAVQELADRNVDIVKIWVDDRNGQYKKLTPDLYTAIIDEAHSHGLRVTAHIFYLEDAKGLLRAGIDSFAHGIRDQDIDEEVIGLFREHPNVVLVPNLPDRGVATDVSWVGSTVPDEQVKEMQAEATDRPAAQETFAIQARNLAKLHAAGVTIALGTDGNTPWGPHLEMADMVATGMPEDAVIAAATRNAAEFMRLTDLGTLEAGKSADFLVLDANPLDDITNTRRIDAVYMRGDRVDRAALAAELKAGQPAATE